MQKKLLFALFIVVVFQGCKKTPIQPPETLPWINSIQIEPNVKRWGKYITIVGSYIQFQVNAVDSDRIDTSFSFQWGSECGGIFRDTVCDSQNPEGHLIPQDNVVKTNVARWYPDTVTTGKIHITVYDSRDSTRDTLIGVQVFPYKYEGEIIDSSLQMPMGFGVSPDSDEIAIVDAKNMEINLYSKTSLTPTGYVAVPETIENPVDVVFDDFNRMYLSSDNGLVRFVKDASGNYVCDTSVNLENGRYFYYHNGKIYLTIGSSYDLFTVYDTTLTNILPPVSGPSSFSKSPRGGITTDDLGRNIYVVAADMYGEPYLRTYNENGDLVTDNYFASDSLPDSTAFYSIFYLNNDAYVCGSSPGWDGVYRVNKNIPNDYNFIWKWGTGGSSGPDRFSLILDAYAKGDTFYLLDAGNKSLKKYTYIH